MPVSLSGRMDCVLRVSQLPKARRGSLKGEESKGIKCQEARSSPTHLSERREAGRNRTSGG